MPTGWLELAVNLMRREGWTSQLDAYSPPQPTFLTSGHREQALSRSAHQPCTEPLRLQKQGPEQKPGGGDMTTATHLSAGESKGAPGREPRDPQHLATQSAGACTTEEPEGHDRVRVTAKKV